MSAIPLTKAQAIAANLPLIENKRGTQALQESIVALRANRRTGSASTKTRNEVSGSGKKLWRQKGTGRARVGSVRSPIWVGGGVVFGPRPRDYSKKITKKAKKLALRRALTNLVEAQRFYTAEPFSVTSGKTKDFISSVRSFLPTGKVLLVGESFDELTYRAARNVQDVLLMKADEVNVEQLLMHKHVVALGPAVQTLANRAS